MPDKPSLFDATSHLEGLNPEQREATEHFEGPILVLAGAGSGKTRVLTARICHLIREHGVPPNRILAVTFTNKAAGEMRERIARLLGSEPAGMWMGTFHAIGARILRRHADRLGWDRTFTIFDAEQSLRLVKSVQERVGLDPKRWSPKALRAELSNAKNQLVTAEGFAKDNEGSFDLFVRNVAKVFGPYQQSLQDQNAFDFDDLLQKPVELFEQNPELLARYRERFAFVLVDEYQDTNRAQFRFLELLASEHGNLMVVGDDDQCLPAGTPVATPSGEIAVECLRAGHEVVGGCGAGESAPATVEAVRSRRYDGPIVRIETGSGKALRLTPNHLVFARLRTAASLWYVYLMRRDGVGYRIGITRGVRARRSGEITSGLAVRTNQEQADALWVLSTHESESEARYAEARLALAYGIPTTVFQPRGRAIALTERQIVRLHEELDTLSRGERLLDDLLLFPEYPHHVPNAVVRGRTVRRRVVLTLFGDGRAYLGRPWRDHRVQLVTSGDGLRRHLEALGFPVREGARGTWRVETARRDHDEAYALARRLAREVEGSIVVRASLTERHPKTVRVHPHVLMPASHVLPGMDVAVTRPDGAVVDEHVVGRTIDDYGGDVHDLSVRDLRNYVAGGLCVHNSIYGWRGADIRNILDFEQTFPGAAVVRLERNYRSTQKILDAANAVIAENVNRKGKTLRTERTGGEPITLVETFDEGDEARWIVGDIEARFADAPLAQYRSFAVLYRTNAQARALEDAFRRAGVPYQVVGSVRFYERREIQDVLAYLRLISNPRDAGAFERVVNYPRRGVGMASQERLAEWAEVQGLTLLEAAERADEAPDVPAGGVRGLRGFAALIRKYSLKATQARVGEVLEQLVEELDLGRHLMDEGPEGEDRARNVAELIAGALDFDAELVESVDAEDVDTFTELDLFLQQVALVADVDRLDPDADAVTLMTLHNAKGLEFPVVYIAGLEDGLFPLSRAYDDPDTLEEERRLFYVGITRAEEKLNLVWARQRRRAGDFTYGTLSSFVDAIPDELRDKRVSERLRLAAASTPHRGYRAARDEDRDRVSYEPDFEADAGVNQDQPRYVKGERVVHATFGSGSVVEVTGFGRDLKVTVDFDDAGRKKLLVRYANLEKDWP